MYIYARNINYPRDNLYSELHKNKYIRERSELNKNCPAKIQKVLARKALRAQIASCWLLVLDSKSYLSKGSKMLFKNENSRKPLRIEILDRKEVRSQILEQDQELSQLLSDSRTKTVGPRPSQRYTAILFY